MKLSRAMRWLLALTVLISTFSAQVVRADDDVLDNQTIIDLTKMGLGEGIVIDKINSSHCNFDTSIAGLKKLKGANVPDGVISAMINQAKGVKGRLNEDSGDPNDVKSPHDAGIYIAQDVDGKMTLTELEPTVYTQSKSGIALFAGYGQTAKQKAVIHPAHAALQLTTRKPVFYFYFENTKAGLGETRNVATSPNEFVLAQLEFKDKDKLRQLVVGQFNAYTGGQSGPEDKACRGLTPTKLAPGIYKVVPTDDLADGEYAFFYGGNAIFGSGVTTSGGKLFDFGISGATPAPAAPAKK